MRKEIRICGFGGQGIILAGVILGEAAAKAGFEAVQTQSYGPESRGGAARSEVVIATEPIDYPRVTKADILVALSQPAFEKYGRGLDPGCELIVDEGVEGAEGAAVLPFLLTAEKVGHKIVANMVMLGYLGARLEFLPDEILEATVLANVPPGTEELNRKAVRAGRAMAGAKS